MSTLKASFRDHPGCRERHLRRKLDNPLFGAPERRVTPHALHTAQRRDDDELATFLGAVRTLVSQVSALTPDSNRDALLELTRHADTCYEQCPGLPGDQRRVKSALVKLIAELTRLHMRTLRDAAALAVLQEEQVRRLAHFTALEFPLTGDICRAQSPIAGPELVPTLLSEPGEAVEAALGLFDRPRITAIRNEAERLIAQRRAQGHQLAAAGAVLATIEHRLAASADDQESAP